MVSGFGADTLWVIDDGLTGLGALDETSFGVTEYAYGTGESIGDVDFDGFDDAILCPSGYGVYCTVAYGSATGLAAAGGTMYVYGYRGGLEDNGAPGSATTSGGDLNGDGVSDFARLYGSSAYVHLGTQGVGITSSTFDAEITGSNQSASMVEILIDVTGDGYRDLAVTHRNKTVFDPLQGNLSHAGIVAILPGGATLPATTTIDATGTAIVGDSQSDHVGIDADAADVDGDGVGDLLVTANDGNEAPRLFYGPIAPGSHLISTSDARFVGSTSNYSGVARAGDTNADGYEDFLVGRIRDSSNGSVHLFTGTSN
jgi:hypothetical protein